MDSKSDPRMGAVVGHHPQRTDNASFGECSRRIATASEPVSKVDGGGRVYWETMELKKLGNSEEHVEAKASNDELKAILNSSHLGYAPARLSTGDQDQLKCTPKPMGGVDSSTKNSYDFSGEFPSWQEHEQSLAETSSILSKGSNAIDKKDPANVTPSVVVLQRPVKSRGRSLGEASCRETKRRRALAEQGDFTAAFELGWGVDRLTRIWNENKNKSLPPDQQVPLDQPIDDQGILEEIEKRKRKQRASSKTYTAGLKVRARFGDEHALNVLNRANRAASLRKVRAAVSDEEDDMSEEETSTVDYDSRDDSSTSQGGVPVPSPKSITPPPAHIQQLVRLSQSHQAVMQRTAMAYQAFVANQRREADLWWKIQCLHKRHLRAGVLQTRSASSASRCTKSGVIVKQQRRNDLPRKRNQGLLYWREPTAEREDEERDGKTPENAIEVE